MRELRLEEAPVIGAQVLDFWKVNQELKKIFTPKLRKQVYRLYSFCKYCPAKNEETDCELLLFLESPTKPLKVRLLTESHESLCSTNIYMNHAMLNFIGKLNTFVLCLP
jgi:hypothetical protein